MTSPVENNEPEFLSTIPIPVAVLELVVPDTPELVWRNQAGGMTFRVGERFLKWNPTGSGIDLRAERDRLEWISARHPAPRVLEFGADEHGEWLFTQALPGGHAVGDSWRARPREAVHAIAAGLRAIHAIDITDFPQSWSDASWLTRRTEQLGARPGIEHPVLVHGDACAPNTLIAPDGSWVGNVDFGALAVGDRWADLAVAMLSLGWNFPGEWEDEFLDAYGIARDVARIAYYRALWELES